MTYVTFIRKDKHGNVIEKGTAPVGDFALMKRKKRGYEIDEHDTPLMEIVPVAPIEVVPDDTPTLEELTQAVLRLADGDRSAVEAIRKKVKDAKPKRTAGKRAVRKRR